MQVGSLLLAFLPTSLQEQISSRKYFYKSGRLIKDGIITLSNTDFSRDIMDQVCLHPVFDSVHLLCCYIDVMASVTAAACAVCFVKELGGGEGEWVQGFWGG